MSGYDIVPPNQNFRGMSYGEWGAEWWKWLLSSKNPDYSKGDPVLFLRGAFDYEQVGEQRRPKRKPPHYDRTGDKKIEIFEGTAIFFPVIEAEFNEEHPDPDDRGEKITTEAKMRYFARRDIDEGGPMKATIKKGNGTPTKIVDDLKDYRAESPLFKLVVSGESPIKDYLEVLPKDGTFDAVADGYWILIRSLPPSDEPYQIHFEAKGRGDYSNSATYDITVKPKPPSSVEDKSDILVTGNSLRQK
jgi:hypothetical protein